MSPEIILKSGRAKSGKDIKVERLDAIEM